MRHDVHVNRGGNIRSVIWGKVDHIGSREGEFGIPCGAMVWGAFITPGMYGEMDMGVSGWYLQDGEEERCLGLRLLGGWDCGR